VKESIQPRFNQIRNEENDEKHLSSGSSPMIEMKENDAFLRKGIEAGVI